MLGNDIADFSDPALQEKHKDIRFLDRVFTEEEKTAILKAENGSTLLWALWSAKEAAFKACQKHNPEIIFSPKNFRVKMDPANQSRDDSDEGIAPSAVPPPSSQDWFVGSRHSREIAPQSGVLHYHHQQLDLLWAYPTANVIHCCAVLNENNSIFTRWNEIHTLIKRISGEKNSSPSYPQQSKAAREALIHFLQTKFQMSENLYISRPEILINGIVKKGPPILIEGETRLRHCEISLSHDNEWIAAVFYS